MDITVDNIDDLFHIEQNDAQRAAGARKKWYFEGTWSILEQDWDFQGTWSGGVGWGGGVFRDPGPVRPLSGKFWHIKPYAQKRGFHHKKSLAISNQMFQIRIWGKFKPDF